MLIHIFYLSLLEVRKSKWLRLILVNLEIFSFFLMIFVGKMFIHPLNFVVGVKTPPELSFWPIYSLKFTLLPNQYFCWSLLKH